MKFYKSAEIAIGHAAACFAEEAQSFAEQVGLWGSDPEKVGQAPIFNAEFCEEVFAHDFEVFMGDGELSADDAAADLIELRAALAARKWA